MHFLFTYRKCNTHLTDDTRSASYACSYRILDSVIFGMHIACMTAFHVAIRPSFVLLLMAKLSTLTVE